MSEPQPIERTGRGMSPVQPLALGGIPGDIYRVPEHRSPEIQIQLDKLAAAIAQNSVEIN